MGFLNVQGKQFINLHYKCPQYLCLSYLDMPLIVITSKAKQRNCNGRFHDSIKALSLQVNWITSWSSFLQKLNKKIVFIPFVVTTMKTLHYELTRYTFSIIAYKDTLRFVTLSLATTTMKRCQVKSQDIQISFEHLQIFT